METLFIIISAVGTAAFGIAALLTDFREGPKRLVVVVIMGIGASALLSVTSNRLSAMKQEKTSAVRHENLLRTMWDNDTRVDPGRIRAIIEYKFVTGILQDPPKIFTDAWEFSLRVRKGKLKELKLATSSQEISRQVHKTVDDEEWKQVSVVTGFSGEMGDFTEPIRWNNATVQVSLTAYRDKALACWQEIVLPEYRDFVKRMFSENYTQQQLMEKYEDFGPLPCEAQITLYVSGRSILSSSTIPVGVRTWDEDVTGLIKTDLPQIKLADDVFPEFSKRLGKAKFPWILYFLIGGWFLIAVVLGAGVMFIVFKATEQPHSS
ncbi:hypothetical protein ACFL6S_00790 [Candidatus Poribacteria bacterium]